MPRLVITLVYAALTAIGAVTMYWAMGTFREDVDQRLKTDVELSHEAYKSVARLRDLQLRDLAVRLADGDIAAYLSVLEQFRGEMLQVEADVYRAVPGAMDDEAVRAQREAVVREKVDYLDRFAGAVASRIEVLRGPGAWADKPKAQFLQDTKDALVVCNAHSVSTCFFRMTWYPLETAVREVRGDGGNGLRPDLVVVTDSRGTGLANADRRKWSDDSGFADRYPVLKGVREGVVLRDVVRLDGDESQFVAAAPIFEGGRFRGAVLVGVDIDDAFIQKESQILGMKVTYLDGRAVLRTSLSTDYLADMKQKLPPTSESATLYTLTSDLQKAQYVPLTGNYLNKDVRVVLSVDRHGALEAVSTMQSMTLVYGLLMFLIGLALIISVIRAQLRPLVALDTGVHEVINGNYDYEFPHEFHDKLWNAFAQSLNLMVGLLLGREMVDEDDLGPGGAWQGLMPSNAAPSGDQAGGGAAARTQDGGARAQDGEVHFELVPVDLSPSEATSLAQEPTDRYYERIWRQYVAGQASAIALPQFAERVAAKERDLIDVWGCRAVRFHVVQTPTGHALAPLRLG